MLAASAILVSMLYMAGARYVRTRRYHALPPGGQRDMREHDWIVQHGALSGIVWGLSSFITMTTSTVANAGMIIMLFPALMFTGSLTIDMVYGSAVRFIAFFTLGVSAALLVFGTPLAFYGLVCMVLYCVLFIWRAKLSGQSFAIRNIRAAEADDAAETVHLLLNEYEEHASDWLWEADGDRRIVKPSDRFQAAARADAAALAGTPLFELFDDDHDRAVLQRLLEKGQSFRDVVAKRTVGDEEFWWSLSGRPILDRDGAVTGMRGVASDVTAAKRAEARVAYLAHYDSLTDLPNRMLFNETLARALARRRDDGFVAVLYADLDHFKAINDTLGHGVGDHVLKVAASRIEALLGLQDMVSRLGGDEFAVLLADVRSHDDAIAIALQITTAMAEPIMVEGQQILIGSSVGVAFAPDHGNIAGDLIKHADLALYHAKENGRGSHAVFEAGMHEAMQAKRMVEVDLRVALSREQLELFYQPLINIESGAITGYEALLRWNHPDNGMVMPDVFIPVAEETGLIVPLGEWVIRNALMEVTRWPEHLSVSVNLSPAQMRSSNLLPTVINALAASGVPAHRLELEITETVLMHETEANLAVLHQLRSLGVRIALDDFGTGYSSLNYLRSFPFDKIKIDRCFVDDVDSRDDSRAIIRAVTGLASSLGMVTTAEGVEREDQLDQLRSEGCTEVQGYFFARPLPARNVVGRSSNTVEAASPKVGAVKPSGCRAA